MGLGTNHRFVGTTARAVPFVQSLHLLGSLHLSLFSLFFFNVYI